MTTVQSVPGSSDISRVNGKLIMPAEDDFEAWEQGRGVFRGC